MARDIDANNTVHFITYFYHPTSTTVSGVEYRVVFHSKQRRSTTATNTFAFTSSRSDVH